MCRPLGFPGSFSLNSVANTSQLVGQASIIPLFDTVVAGEEMRGIRQWRHNLGELLGNLEAWRQEFR